MDRLKKLIEHQIEEQFPGRTRHVRVLLAFDGTQSETRAMNLMDSVASNLEDTCFLHYPWRMDWFCHEQMTDLASAEMMAADMVVVSLSGYEAVPHQFTNAVRRWASRKPGSKRSLVVTYSDEGDWRTATARSIQAEFRAIAQEFDIELLHNQPFMLHRLSSQPEVLHFAS